MGCSLPDRYASTAQRLPHASFGFAELPCNRIQRLSLCVKLYRPVDFVLGHRLVPHLDAVLAQDLQQPALRKTVPLAQLVGGGSESVGVDHLGNGGCRQPSIQPPRSHRAAVRLRRPAGWSSVNLLDHVAQPVRFPLFQIPSANPDWNGG